MKVKLDPDEIIIHLKCPHCGATTSEPLSEFFGTVGLCDACDNMENYLEIDSVELPCPDYPGLLRSLLNKVNRVTSAFRHGVPVTDSNMEQLCNRQIEVEDKMGRL